MTTQTIAQKTNGYIHWRKGAQVGQWSYIELACRQDAIAFATARARSSKDSVVVHEEGVHHTLSHERIEVFPDGRVVSEHVTTIA